MNRENPLFQHRPPGFGSPLPSSAPLDRYSFTTSICLSSTWPVNRSIATCTQ